LLLGIPFFQQQPTVFAGGCVLLLDFVACCGLVVAFASGFFVVLTLVCAAVWQNFIIRL
jgi:hypothetical protein